MEAEGAKLVGDSVEEEISAADEEAGTGGGRGGFVVEGGDAGGAGVRTGHTVAFGKFTLQDVGPEGKEGGAVGSSPHKVVLLVNCKG